MFRQSTHSITNREIDSRWSSQTWFNHRRKTLSHFNGNDSYFHHQPGAIFAQSQTTLYIVWALRRPAYVSYMYDGMWWVMKQSTMQSHSEQKTRIPYFHPPLFWLFSSALERPALQLAMTVMKKWKKPAAKSFEMRTTMYKRNTETKLPLSKHFPLWIYADGLAIKMRQVSVSCACSP